MHRRQNSISIVAAMSEYYVHNESQGWRYNQIVEVRTQETQFSRIGYLNIFATPSTRGKMLVLRLDTFRPRPTTIRRFIPRRQSYRQ
jgi:hypothetical protein